MPNPGKIKMYTSGCPKNQNKCWYKIGSPPPHGSKNEVLKLRSVSNIVIAPASTGRDSNSKIAVIRTDHTKSGIFSNFIEFILRLRIVVIKLMAPKMEEIPAKWSEKMVKSTALPPWKIWVESGGYTVHPVPAPMSVIEEANKRVNEGGSSQNLILFIRGNAISGAPNIMGTNQLPNPPIIVGITIKKIITKAWEVTIVLYSWSFWGIRPGWDNLIRIIILIAAPKIPDQRPKQKYIVPMSLWFVDIIHRFTFLRVANPLRDMYFKFIIFSFEG